MGKGVFLSSFVLLCFLFTTFAFATPIQSPDQVANMTYTLTSSFNQDGRQPLFSRSPSPALAPHARQPGKAIS